MAKTHSIIRSRATARKKKSSPILPPTVQSCVCIEEEVEIPLGIDSLDRFREWALSDDFPERGRIDYINGRIEVDMSPESAFTHGMPKVEIATTLNLLLRKNDFAALFVDRMRISLPKSSVSVEPDIAVVSWESMDQGRVKLTPQKSREDDCVEFVGPPVLIVEIVSDSSVNKDLKRLPPAYFAGGVEELWLVDARESGLKFEIMNRGSKQFMAMGIDSEGHQQSTVFGRRFKLRKKADARGIYRYRLTHKPI